MLFLTQSAAVFGVDALTVDIEVNLQPNNAEADKSPPVIIVGLPDTAVRESRERIPAAIFNSSYFFPYHKTTINLAPADVRKEGASFDLPIALGILGANGELGAEGRLENFLSIGELSLDGRVRPVRGALSIALRARDEGIENLLLPEENAPEAAVVGEINVFPVKNLRQAAEICHAVSSGHPTETPPLKVDPDALMSILDDGLFDFNEVRGQQTAKR
ncbi:MAG: magnesium chelatase, partial [Acidobacteriota bacterium]|nr:magnesium chelatase [Acidobacteriota bacterium]